MTKLKWTTFKDKTVSVTGASSGIGLSISKELAKRGANLILVARSEDKLKEVAAIIRKTGREAYIFKSDLSVPNSAEVLYNAINKVSLTVDLLINNAGYGRWGEFTSFKRTDYAKMIQLNINSLTDLCHLFIPDMVKKGSGGIINVGSMASFGPIPYANVYSSTKTYVLNFTEALRYEYLEKGIQIMALCPGATQSNFATNATEKSKVLQERVNKMERSNAYISSEEVANICLNAFLKNKMYVITEGSNKILHAIGRHLSRKAMLNLAGNMFKRVTGE